MRSLLLSQRALSQVDSRQRHTDPVTELPPHIVLTPSVHQSHSSTEYRFAMIHHPESRRACRAVRQVLQRAFTLIGGCRRTRSTAGPSLNTASCNANAAPTVGTQVNARLLAESTSRPHGNARRTQQLTHCTAEISAMASTSRLFTRDLAELPGLRIRDWLLSILRSAASAVKSG